MRMHLQAIIALMLISGTIVPAEAQQTRAVELVDRANLLYRTGKIDSAIALTDSAIHSDSSYLPAYSQKCALLWASKRNEDALKTARAAFSTGVPSIPSWSLLGLAYEHVREPDSARICYRRATAYAGKEKSLPFPQGATMAAMLTVTKGKYYGLRQLEHLRAGHNDSGDTLNPASLKSLKNEIQSYEGGGLLEFSEGEPRQYCITTGKSIEEVSEDLLDKGINIQRITQRPGGYFIMVRDKFRSKVVALGLVECK